MRTLISFSSVEDKAGCLEHEVPIQVFAFFKQLNCCLFIIDL